ESLSVVDYILSVYGNSALVDLVDRLGRGQLIGEAIRDSLGLSYETLEENWRRRLQRNMSWAAYGARNITAILFFFMALVTVAAFIRFLIKKRQYKDGDDEEEETSDGNGLH
ncbi:MAG: hypothetical protein JW884_14785, partial [Deltaproteobacteria bacterium]|nr:hypothetical protein [Deltaproteobacteria bacterium]